MNNAGEMNDLFDLFDSKQISFEQLLSLSGNTNAEELHEQIHLHRAAKRAIRKYAIMQQVAGIHHEYSHTGSKSAAGQHPTPVKMIQSHSVLKWTMRIAASVTLLIGLYAAQYFAFYSPEKMYAGNFREYNVNTERSEAVIADNEMVTAFRNEDYKKVIGLYGKFPATGNKEKFLAGYSYLEVDNYAAAEGLFRDIINGNKVKGSSYFQDEAEYYLAMAKLKQGDAKGALELMNKIYKSEEHTYHELVTGWMIFRLKWY